MFWHELCFFDENRNFMTLAIEDVKRIAHLGQPRRR